MRIYKKMLSLLAACCMLLSLLSEQAYAVDLYSDINNDLSLDIVEIDGSESLSENESESIEIPYETIQNSSLEMQGNCIVLTEYSEPVRSGELTESSSGNVIGQSGVCIQSDSDDCSDFSNNN